ncbi:hypothetical protein QBC34DRAFT_383355 [Podospora aff. communis PSN243]|uniref:Uncharacterized protein n=1 Tax=Podospora aff. communis PSN243 TaxID=3040156 RepID=A0AAV9GFM8_9PEZI|nr:hypothetical protein QBC34DRAFT_383355 [Podospora aff. communis PSN243]
MAERDEAASTTGSHTTYESDSEFTVGHGSLETGTSVCDETPKPKLYTGNDFFKKAGPGLSKFMRTHGYKQASSVKDDESLPPRVVMPANVPEGTNSQPGHQGSDDHGRGCKIPQAIPKHVAPEPTAAAPNRRPTWDERVARLLNAANDFQVTRGRDYSGKYPPLVSEAADAPPPPRRLDLDWRVAHRSNAPAPRPLAAADTFGPVPRHSKTFKATMAPQYAKGGTNASSSKDVGRRNSSTEEVGKTSENAEASAHRSY